MPLRAALPRHQMPMSVWVRLGLATSTRTQRVCWRVRACAASAAKLPDPEQEGGRAEARFPPLNCHPALPSLEVPLRIHALDHAPCHAHLCACLSALLRCSWCFRRLHPLVLPGVRCTPPHECRRGRGTPRHGGQVEANQRRGDPLHARPRLEGCAIQRTRLHCTLRPLVPASAPATRRLLLPPPTSQRSAYSTFLHNPFTNPQPYPKGTSAHQPCTGSMHTARQPWLRTALA